ncbi:MAG: TetR/AcrR family transcriptional regulator [bacterium]|nr:TetR/AcrR family transcriptional regulator [bacterium]
METPNNATRERILEVAEELFTKRGYASVKLRDIADVVGIKHASLYYYAPDGKKQLFIEVMERNFKRHHEGLNSVIQGAGDDVRQQMVAVAKWFISQPPIEMSRLLEADMTEIDPQQAQHLMNLAYDALRLPIVSALMRARQKAQIRPMDLDLAAMAFISLIQSVHQIPSSYSQDIRQKTGVALVDMLFDGWSV